MGFQPNLGHRRDRPTGDLAALGIHHGVVPGRLPGHPVELREAARIDGASEYQLYRYVLFPQLSPIALSALIILGHMSLKMFDIIMAISGEKNVYTNVPMVNMWTLTGQQDFARAAAVAMILLVLVALHVVPYLVHNARQERNT